MGSGGRPAGLGLGSAEVPLALDAVAAAGLRHLPLLLSQFDPGGSGHVFGFSVKL